MEVIHILPVNDTYDHAESVNCYCRPTVIHDNGVTRVIHNSFDRRELWEPDKQLTLKEWLERLWLTPYRRYRQFRIDQARQKLMDKN